MTPPNIRTSDHQYLLLAARGKNSWIRYFAAAFLGLLLTALALVVVTIVFMFLRWLPSDLNQLTDPNNPIVFFAALGTINGLTVAGFAGAIRIVHKKRIADIIGQWRWRSFILGGAIWLIACVVWTGIDFVIAPDGFSINRIGPTMLVSAVVLAALAVQTFSEEFIFRGWLNQGLFLATKKEASAALFSGLLFGLMHIPNGWPQAIGATGIGIAFAFITMRSVGLAWSTGMHFTNNVFAAIIVVYKTDVFSGSPGFISQNTPGLIWWDTIGVFVLVTIVVLALNRFSKSILSGVVIGEFNRSAS